MLGERSQRQTPCDFTYMESKKRNNKYNKIETDSSSHLIHLSIYSPTLTSIHDYWKNYSFD